MICPYCSESDVAVEIFGFTVHKLSDRWIACLDKSSSSPFYDGIIATREVDRPQPFPAARAAGTMARAQLTEAHSR